MSWDLLISKIENGFLLTSTSELNEEFIVEEAVVEQTKNEKGEWMRDQESEATLAHDLLWAVIEQFCLYGSKHDSHRVRVTVEAKEKEEDFEDEAE